MKATYGYAKQGAGYGYSGVKGLDALVATVSSPLAAPVIVATRLRRGGANSARGAARLVADALVTAKAAGAGGPAGTGLVVLRADSAFYGYDVVAAARRAGVRLSVTARSNPRVRAAIASIDETAWTAISYPNAVWDQDEQRLVSDAEIAEVPFTAFTSRRQAQHITGRLIVGRVIRLNPAGPSGGDAEQGELFAANSAWPVLAAIAFNLTRATGTLASAFHARTTTATIRTQLINVPARLARSARRLRTHLPEHQPWAATWTQLFTATHSPPART